MSLRSCCVLSALVEAHFRLIKGCAFLVEQGTRLELCFQPTWPKWRSRGFTNPCRGNLRSVLFPSSFPELLSSSLISSYPLPSLTIEFLFCLSFLCVDGTGVHLLVIRWPISLPRHLSWGRILRLGRLESLEGLVFLPWGLTMSGFDTHRAVSMHKSG